MLTSTHLVLLNAAMTFFDEENSPHGSQVIALYLNEPLDPLPTAADVAELRTLMQHCQLKYALCDVSLTRLIDDRFYASLEDAERRLTESDQRLVTALCFQRPA